MTSSLRFKSSYPQIMDPIRDRWVSKPLVNYTLDYAEIVLESLREKLDTVQLSEIAWEAGAIAGQGRFWVRVTGGHDDNVPREVFVRALGIPPKRIQRERANSREGRAESPDIFMILPEAETCRSLGIAPQSRA